MTKKASAPTIQRKNTDITGTLQFVGKVPFHSPQWQQYALDRAKGHATGRLERYLKSLASEGKTWNKPQVTDRLFVDGNVAVYVIRADFD